MRCGDAPSFARQPAAAACRPARDRTVPAVRAGRLQGRGDLEHHARPGHARTVRPAGRRHPGSPDHRRRRRDTVPRRIGRPAAGWSRWPRHGLHGAIAITITAPRHSRAFFEALAAGNLDIGRPDNMEIIFNRQVRCVTKGVFPHRVDRDRRRRRGQRLPPALPDQDLSQGRPDTAGRDRYQRLDIGVLRGLEHFGELTAKARDVNARVMQAVRAGQGCVLASPAIERVAQPALTEDGRRAPAVRFGGPRVMALVGALALTLFGACGLSSKSLRALTARLLGASCRYAGTAADSFRTCDRSVTGGEFRNALRHGGRAGRGGFFVSGFRDGG